MKIYSKGPKNSIAIIVLTVLFAASFQAIAQDECCELSAQKSSLNLKDNSLEYSLPEIHPYVNANALHDNDSHNKTGIGLDAFIPVAGTNTELFFSNMKLNSYSNKTFDGGLYFGYRRLLPEAQKLCGVYVALDFKNTENNNYFKQITLGAEYWLHQWYFGYKIFSPVGKNDNGGKVVPGIGADIGYEFSKKTAVHLEGYYLNQFNTNNVPGVGIKLKQNLLQETRSTWLDQVNLEIGVQKDRLAGTRVLAELKFKMGVSANNSAIDGVAAHMTDTISRNRVFVEQETKMVMVDADCYYWKDAGELAKHGSNSVCPRTYSAAIAKNSGNTLIDTFQDRAFYGVSLRVPVTVPR